jgi:hypothetical protein
MKYVKKPIVVDAISMKANRADIMHFLAVHEISFVGFVVDRDFDKLFVTTVDGNNVEVPDSCYLVIDTKGFPYPCDAEIFEANHEEYREGPPAETCLHRLVAEVRTNSTGWVVVCASGCDSTLDYQFIREFYWDYNIDSGLYEQRKTDPKRTDGVIVPISCAQWLEENPGMSCTSTKAQHVHPPKEIFKRG